MTEQFTDGALVLLSGGQDSTTCLAWALDRFPTVETIGFDYRQRHSVELECRASVREGLAALRPDWAGKLGADHMLDLATLASLGETAMTHDVEIHMTAANLPNTFVPGRNLLFLTFAAALAYRRGLRHIVTGVCETDYSGYPDCRDDTHQGPAGGAQSRHGKALRPPHSSDVDRQGRHMATCRGYRRRAAGGAYGGTDPHLLQRRPKPSPCLGIWLWRVPGLRSAGSWLGNLCSKARPCGRLRKPLMFSLIFSRRYSMAHRLLSGGSPKCAVPHGHNETVTVKLKSTRPQRLDGGANMVEPFERAKKQWHSWIDNHVDHAFQVSDRDPLIEVFARIEPEILPRLMVMPGDPTTELLAACFMAKLNAFLAADGGRLTCVEVQIEETPTNTVSFDGDPAQVIPAGTGDDSWWWRADNSINDLMPGSDPVADTCASANA